MSLETACKLIPTVVQDARNGQVLMLAWSNEESRGLTLRDGRVWFYSRSRQRLWLKGETSGNTLELVDALLDCDGDALLYRVVPAGPACHTLNTSCFHRVVTPGRTRPGISADELHEVIMDRMARPVEGSYTSSLLNKGLPAILDKVREEALEVIDAAGDRRHLIEEIADLSYHLLVLMAATGVTPGDIRGELGQRRSNRRRGG